MNEARLSIGTTETAGEGKDPKEQAYEGTSIRWKHFSTSYGLAAKKISMGWSYDDFAQCIPGWAAAQPVQANDVCKQISDYVHDSVMAEGENIFERYKAAEGIDALHQVISEARVRKASGRSSSKDVWTAVLDPKTAVRARVLPVLQEEKVRLQSVLTQLESENEDLAVRLRTNREQRLAQDALAREWLDALAETAEALQQIPKEKIQQWSIENQETNI